MNSNIYNFITSSEFIDSYMQPIIISNKKIKKLFINSSKSGIF